MTRSAYSSYISEKSAGRVTEEAALRYVGALLREASGTSFHGRVMVEANVHAGQIKSMKLDLEKTIKPIDGRIIK